MGVGAGKSNEIHVVWKWRGKYWAGFKRGGEKGDGKGSRERQPTKYL